ncbi:hypothetical protein GJ496_009116 [Pomphorhynchus laevis]|nr:hypothetical protein GJ496_009116 [Pomphorhynchus laevis]
MLHETSLKYEKCHRSMYICCILFQTYFNFIGAYEVTFDVTSTCQMAGWFVAESYNCRYLGQVGGLSNSCYMDCNDSSTFNRLGTPRRLRRNNIQVNLIEKQKLLVRKKRGFEASFTDPEWKNMWYLNRNSLRPDLVDHNVSAVWKMGYTGRGVTVTFLDDGLEHTHPDLIANYVIKNLSLIVLLIILKSTGSLMPVSTLIRMMLILRRDMILVGKINTEPDALVKSRHLRITHYALSELHTMQK